MLPIIPASRWTPQKYSKVPGRSNVRTHVAPLGPVTPMGAELKTWVGSKTGPGRAGFWITGLRLRSCQ